jgi:hypothetical protein
MKKILYILLLFSCNKITKKQNIDMIQIKHEEDSIDNYMKYWYEVLDTNSNGEIDNTE